MYTTKLNKTTQKAERWIKQYFTSSCFSVKNYYGRCSQEKISIEEKIRDRIISKNLHGYKILNGNCFYFTCGYMDESENILYIETSCNIFAIDLRD